MSIIFSDLDNTLLFDKKIKEKDLLAIEEWKEKGNLFALSTGRGKVMMTEVFERYPNLCDYYILNNGALILDKDKKILKEAYIPKDIVFEILNHLDEKEYTIAIETTKNLYSFGKYEDDICPEVGDMAIEIKKAQINDIKEKIIFLNCAPKDGSLDKAIYIEKLLKKYFSDKVSIFRNKHWVDVVALFQSKGEGINSLITIKELSNESIYVIGDSLNDISMFDKYQNSFTFSDSEEIVKNKAKNIINDFSHMVEKII